MTKIQRLEREIKQLSPNELAAFRKWFDEYNAVEWDKQIEQDAIDGKLDRLADKALRDHKEGRSKEI